MTRHEQGHRSGPEAPSTSKVLFDEISAWPALLGEVLNEAARRYDDRVAIVADSGAATYSELAEHARLVAKAVLARGYGRGTRVAVLFPNGPEWVATTFGLAMVGAVPVLLNWFSPPAELIRAIEFTSANMLIMNGEQSAVDDVLDALATSAVWQSPRRSSDIEGTLQLVVGPAVADRERYVSMHDFLESARTVRDGQLDDSRAALEADDEALVILTSGTSGESKGVVHRQRSPLRQFVTWRQLQAITTDERVFTTYPFCWSAGLARCLGATLVAGATLVTIGRFDPGRAIELMRDAAVTSVITPNEGHLDTRLIEHPAFSTKALSSVRRASNARLCEALDLGEPWIPRGYGMSETFTLVTGTPVPVPHDTPTGSVGTVLPGWHVRIDSLNTGEPLRAGETGRIAVNGPALMSGYIGRPWDEVFDPDGYFLTSDLGHFDENGHLFFAGRADDMVRSAGVNVSTVEVQREIVAHPDVRLAVVLGLPDPNLGQILVACVVSQSDNLSSGEVTKWLDTRIASYKQPRRVFIMREDELEFTASEKVRISPLRAELQRRMAMESQP